MTNDKLKGKGKTMVGKAKEALGGATGDERMRTEGQGDQAEGKISTRPEL